MRTSLVRSYLDLVSASVNLEIFSEEPEQFLCDNQSFAAESGSIADVDCK